MKYKADIKIKSVTLNLSDLIEIAKISKTISQEDGKGQSYKYNPDYKIECSDGSGYSTDNPEEFKNALDDSIEKIERITFYFNGYRNNLNFYFSKLGTSSLNIQSIDKGRLLTLQDDLKKTLKRNNYNYIVHKFWAGPFVIAIIQIFTVTTTLVVFPHVFNNIINIGKARIELAYIINNLSVFLLVSL